MFCQAIMGTYFQFPSPTFCQYIKWKSEQFWDINLLYWITRTNPFVSSLAMFKLYIYSRFEKDFSNNFFYSTLATCTIFRTGIPVVFRKHVMTLFGVYLIFRKEFAFCFLFIQDQTIPVSQMSRGTFQVYCEFSPLIWIFNENGNSSTGLTWFEDWAKRQIGSFFNVFSINLSAALLIVKCLMN